MDQVKIGKFIAERRKEKKLTQTQLAEKLCITDRAISKWENGKGMPDSSLMIELSNLLGISVNELLEGERVKQENYHKVAEENLVKLQEHTEGMQKKAHILQTIFTTSCVFFSLLIFGVLFVHMAMNYLVPWYEGELFELIGPLSCILVFVFIGTSGILTFQEKYIILSKGGEKVEQKENLEVREDEVMKKKLLTAEKILWEICIGSSIATIFFFCVHIFYQDIVKYAGGEFWNITGGVAIWTVAFFWIYTFLMNFNRKYTIRKKK